MNLFVPGPAAEPEVFAGYVRGLEAEGLQVGAPRFDDDDWEAKLALLERSPVAVVSFTFGLPAPEVLERVRATGAEAWVTVTSVEEARAAAHADALVVQGSEAGGHRGSWVDHEALTPIGLHALLQLIDADVPLIASGGIATAAAVRAALALGASAAQVGTAFLRSPEAGTSEAHRRSARHRRAHRLDAGLQRPARPRHPQPLHGRAPRCAARLPGGPPRDGAGPRRRAQGGRRRADQPVGGRGTRARRSAPGGGDRAQAQRVSRPASITSSVPVR